MTLLLPAAGRAADTPNILFIAVDDLRPELGAYGHPLVQSPHLDRLARDGLLFNRAYCQQALCAPSRTSLMTGRRPGIPGINATDSQNKNTLRQAIAQNLTLPEHLRAHGYTTLNVGKTFHTYDTTAKNAWDREMKPGGGHYQRPENLQAQQRLEQQIRDEGPSARWKYGGAPASESADAPDDQYQTHRIADRAIQMLREHRAKQPDRPFFLGVGFYKPHLPLIAPQRYWELYDRDQIQVPSYDHPPGVSRFALVPTWYEMRLYGDIPRGQKPLSPEKARELIHGYYACVSFVDVQVGRLLDELDHQGLAQNTVVVVWGDHGWKLNDYGDWSKYTNMEFDTRIPLIVRGPGVEPGQTDALVELIDLYPTLCELAGADVPGHVEATSFVPLLADHDRPWKQAALSYYDRRNPDGEGLSIRDPRWRYTEWRDYQSGQVLDRELYDHAAGPRAEKNLAADPAHADTVERLAAMLHAGWRSLTPQDTAPATEP